jgi:hypothetical protein
MVGHVAVKLPCDAKSESPYKILIGQAPRLNAADFELIKELSKPGVILIRPEQALYRLQNNLMKFLVPNRV